jgi:hypothetical protein
MAFGGQMATFLGIATPLIERGIPVIPVAPLEKSGVLKDQFAYATTDLLQIEQWNAENPAFNVGVVAKPDGIVVLDCDVVGLIARIERETGHQFPPTLMVKSAGKGCDHLYFRQTDISRSLGNQKRAGLFDLQSVDKYVVGPGSRLANGNTYEITKDAPVADFPEWLEIWILCNADLVKKHSGSREGKPVHEDFDFDEFLEFYELSGHQSGDWFIPDICPVAQHKHEQSVRTGFFWNGESLGWHCFAAGCRGSNMTVGQVIKFLNEQKGECYLGPIWDQQEDYSKFEIESADVVPESEKPNGHTATPPIEEEEPLPPVAKQPNPKEFEIVRGKNADGGYTGMMGVMASDIRERPVEWLWKGRLPVGCGMVISGPVACNKSTACTDFVSRVTTGRDWPDGAKNLMGPRKVMICATEDDWETTIKPRLMAADADCSKIISFINCFDTDVNGKPVSRTLQLDKDTRNLYNLMVAHPDLLMVVLDPLSGFYGDMDGNDSKRIRPMMQAVAKVCRRTRTAILMIIHENKKSDVNAVDKMLGSGSVSQVIRAGLRISLDPRNKPNGRLMASIKNSMGKPSGGMRFEIGSKNLLSYCGEELEEICYIEWGEKHDMSADDVMDEARALKKEAQDGLGGADPNSKTGIAMKIFTDALANGKRLHREVHALLDKANVATETKKDARRKLGVKSSKAPPWYWWLPGNEGEEATKPNTPEAKMPDVDVL